MMGQRANRLLVAVFGFVLGIPTLLGMQAQGWRPGQPAPGFRVEEVRGQVEHWRPGSPDVRPLSSESALASGDEIRTGADGYTRIGLEDGSKLEIYPNSWARLGVARSSWMRTLELFLGQVRILIERYGGRPNPYTFATPTAALGVRGTIFQVAVDDAATTMVAVEEGIVHVENLQFPGQGVVVQQGYRTIVRANELPMRPERIPSRGGIFGGMEMKHGRAMEAGMAGRMQGGQSGGKRMGSGGTMGGSGTTGMPPVTPGGMPGGMPGGTMPGMKGKKDHRP